MPLIVSRIVSYPFINIFLIRFDTRMLAYLNAATDNRVLKRGQKMVKRAKKVEKEVLGIVHGVIDGE